MNCTILLHSVTGNTRLITRYAAACLERAGFSCTIHDIISKPSPPDLEAVELLGVAGPTMYFRPTFAMEQFLGSLPPLAASKPAFMLGTAGGDPGAHFDIQAEQLHDKGWQALGAHWVICPESWPVHLAAVRGVGSVGAHVEWATRRYRSLRPWLGIVWPELGSPDEKDRNGLAGFLGELKEKAAAFKAVNKPGPEPMPRGLPGFYTIGRRFNLDLAARATKIKVLPERCSRCGICVKICPAGCFTREHDDQVPLYGEGCTGCWSCYQHCPEDAIAGVLTKPGAGKYSGPSREMKDLFKF